MEVINDIRDWLLTEEIIVNLVSTRIWKYSCIEVKYYASNTISEGKKTADDAEDRCWGMYYPIDDEVLNRKSRETKSLTDFLILGFFRNGEPGLDFDEVQNCSFIRANYEFEYLIK